MPGWVWRVASVVLLGLALVVAVAMQQERQPQPPLPLRQLVIKGQSLRVEVAITEAQRQRGLMFRETLAEGEGMLFVFEREQELAFWMKHTAIPLSIAFIRSDGTIARLQDMQPFDTTFHESEVPVQYALEVPQGFFARHHIAVGDRVEGLEGVVP